VLTSGLDHESEVSAAHGGAKSRGYLPNILTLIEKLGESTSVHERRPFPLPSNEGALSVEPKTQLRQNLIASFLSLLVVSAPHET
jgi:hypothetical protein